MKIRLKPLGEQVIVITGASSGIGLVTARRAAARGASLLLIARSGETLRGITEELTSRGADADWLEADVGDAAAMRHAAGHAVERFGRIDTWINVAGVAIYGKLMETPNDEHEQLFRTNYFGVVHGAQAAVPELKGGGALITVGSIASDIASPMMGAYSASKHAAQALIETLRMELAADGLPISVTLVKPAGIDTPIGQHAANHDAGEAQVPPPTYDPEIVADAILHCAEHPMREITVGGVGRAQVLFATHFKGLYEKLAPIIARNFFDKSKRQPRPSNLFEGVRAGRERSGENSPRTFSIYTSAATHPRIIAGVGLGLIAGVAALAVTRRRSSRQAADE